MSAYGNVHKPNTLHEKKLHSPLGFKCPDCTKRVLPMCIGEMGGTNFAPIINSHPHC